MVAQRTEAAPYLKPLPDISELATPFWDGLRQREFRVPVCAECGHYNWVPYPACRSCYSERLVWTPVSGRATVWSFTVVHRGPGAFSLDVPYVMCLGQLEEQPRPCNVLSILTSVDPAQVAIGMPIEIGFVDIPSEDTTMYEWVPRR
jgi:uncharacterized OB-fold protein